MQNMCSEMVEMVMHGKNSNHALFRGGHKMDTNTLTALQTAYRYVYVNLLALARNDLLIAPTITDAYDPRWGAMCDRYQSFVDQAPAEVKDMADSMMRVQVYELEKMWRFKDDPDRRH